MDTIAPELQVMLPPAAWSRRGFVMTSLASGFALAAQPISAETIITDSNGIIAGEAKVKVADGFIPAYIAMPAAGGSHPTVLVIQEVFGVHEHIKDICRRFAKLGYFAISSELYARQGDASKYSLADLPKLISEIVVKVPLDQVMSDLDATVAYAKSTGQADTARLGVTGFCWGGFATWMYAAHNPDLKAAVAWYGADRKPDELNPKNPLDIAGEVKCPVLALYGGADASIPIDTINKREAACRAAGKTCEGIVYADTPHGFNADYRPSYREWEAKDGWARMLAWFKQCGAA